LLVEKLLGGLRSLALVSANQMLLIILS